MKTSFYSTATFSVVLLLGATGLGRRASVAGPVSGQNKSATTLQPKMRSSAAPCTKASACDDPVVHASKQGKQEADEALRLQICGFLAEYGHLDEVPMEPQPRATPRENTYCAVLKQPDPAAQGKSASGPSVAEEDPAAVDPAVRPKVVIAVLPDPVHTQLALRFDESVDELENSIQDLGWIYDRAWLPWDGKPHEDETDFDKRMENKSGQEGYERSPGAILFRAALDPGTSKPPPPLIVLVVGDTPTGGVDRTSFRNAIEIWQQLTGWKNYFRGKSSGPDDASNPSDASELDILGPTYSGSVPSLKALLREITSHLGSEETEDGYFCPTGKLFTVNVSSGTISDENELYDLSSTPDERYEMVRTPEKECKKLQVRVTSMSANINNEWLGALDFLERHQTLFKKGAKTPIVVARLTEAESNFGVYAIHPPLPPDPEFEQLLKKDDSARAALKIANANKDVAAAATAKRQMLSPRGRKLCVAVVDFYNRQVAAFNLVQRMHPLHFYFPREISNLRTAYEENKIFGFNSQSNTIQTQLHLSLGSNTQGDDTVHNFAGTEGAAAMEAAMSQLANELSRNNVDIVLLSATDVLDEIFVTRYLGQHAPNTAVIVTDTDGLFLRSGDSTMQNAYVISPWSLLPGNETWSEPDPEKPCPSSVAQSGKKDCKDPEVVSQIAELPPVRLHDSAGGQGLYNAVRYLMCVPASQPMEKCDAVPNPNPDPKKPGDAYLRKVTLREYQAPIATWAAKSNHLVGAPPLWLSVVERGRFWPISLVDLDQVGDGMPGQSEWPGEYRRTLPVFGTINYLEDGHEVQLDAVKTTGIQELTPNSILIAACLIGFLLVAHGLACLRARLDRTYAWAYALADEKHHAMRLRLQMALTLAAVPALVFLKTPSEAGIYIRGPYYTDFNWALQAAAVLLACWPLAQLARPWPWRKGRLSKIEASATAAPPISSHIGPPISSASPAYPQAPLPKSQLRASMQFGWKLAVLLAFWFACNKWLWDAIAPSVDKWPSERAFFFYRSGHLFGGSAPVLPLLLLGCAVMVFLLSIFDRLVFYADRIPELPEMSSYPDLRCPSREKVKRLEHLLSGTWDRWRWGLLGAVVTAVALLVMGLREVTPRSLTHGRFDVVVITLSSLVTVLVMYDLAVAVTAWTLLRNDFLQILARSPLRWGFTWIKGWSWRRMWAPGGVSPDTVLDYLRRLAEANRRADSDPALLQAFEHLREEMIREPKEPTAEWAAEVTRRMGLLHHELAVSAETKLIELRAQWQKDFGPITGTDVKEQGLEVRGLREERPLEKYELPADKNDWRAAHDRMAKEEFVALLYLGYVRMVLLQIRNRIVTAAVMYVLLLWGLTSYPFLNHHSIVTFLTYILVGFAVAVIWIYAQMHRDEILSRTTETASGKLDADFFTKILSLVGIPLVTLIASQFPEVSNVLFSWLEPGLSAMR
jgi:hypothetical protein